MVPAESSTATADWISQLGGPTYLQRERATRRLREIGPAAKDQLIAALQHSDAEIRTRARVILEDVLRDDHELKLAALAADLDGTDGHGLPGWDRFRAQLGSSATARALFYQIARDEPIMLESLEQDSVEASRAVTIRAQVLFDDLRNRNFQIPRGTTQRRVPLGTIAAFFLASADPEVLIDEQVGRMIHSLMNQSSYQQQIRSGTYSEHLRDLLGCWIRRDASSQMAYQSLWIAMQHDIKEGLIPATKLVQQSAPLPQMRVFAILAVGKLGTKEQIEMLRPLLLDDSPCNPPHLALRGANPEEGEKTPYQRNQIRDVALAVMMHLAEQKPESFGFTGIRANPQTVYQSNTIGFDSDEKRSAAFKKWDEWSKAHLDSAALQP